MGRVDILVNNAGITRDGLALRMKDEDWQTVIDVNLTAGFRLTRAALRGMMRRRHGRIIGITSVVGVTGNPGQANYAAAKAGMIGMSKSIAAEIAARGITVNCVAPGFIATAMTDRLTAEQRERLAERFPSAGSAPPRRWLPRWSSWRATRRLTSPARPCTSMAVWPWYEAVEPLAGAVDLQCRGSMLCDRTVTLMSTRSRGRSGAAGRRLRWPTAPGRLVRQTVSSKPLR